jgi:polysaccharide export outer membrane protein
MRKVQSLLSVAVLALFFVAAAHAETLLIGPGDLLHLQVVDAPEMEQHPRVTDGGEIPVVGVGLVKVAGLSPADAATLVHDRLIAAHYMNHPEVLITIDQYATQNVSVLGEVKLSGSYPIATSRSIIDVLALAGGLNAVADRNIVIERHGDPAQMVRYNVSNNADSAVANQVMVYPGDTVVVPKAGIVYVLGDVNRPGGYVMSNNASKMTLLQALAEAGGLTHAAKQHNATLIRKSESGASIESDVPLAKLQEGKQPDMDLMAGDVLYVPFSFVRNLATAGAPGIAAATAGAAIYTLP